jgi:hypothetical protein
MGNICKMRILPLLIGSLAVVSVTATAGELSAVQSLQGGHRPADMYKLIFQSDGGICAPILVSLNKPLTVAPSRSASFPADMVLKSDLDVPWSRKRMIDGDDLDFSFIDLANDGTRRAVYRWNFFLHDHAIADLSILPRPLELESWPSDTSLIVPWSSDTPLNPYVIQELYDRTSPADRMLKNQIVLTLALKDSHAAGDWLDFNIVSAAGKYVMLVTPSSEIFGPLHVFALLYHADASPSLVCEFQTSP